MVTVVNNPGTPESNSNAGWIVAGIVIIAAVLIALFVWPGYAQNMNAPAGSSDTNINVTIPDGVGGDRAGGVGEMGGEEMPPQ